MQTEKQQLESLQLLYWGYRAVIPKQHEFKDFFIRLREYAARQTAPQPLGSNITIRDELWRVHFRKGTIHNLTAVNGTRD